MFGGAVRTAPGQASGGSRWMFAPYSARTRGRAGVGGLCGRCVAAVRAGPLARPAPESERPEGGHGGFAAGAGRRGGGRGGVGGSALVVLLLPCALGAAGDECGLRCRQAPLGGAPVGHHLGVWLLGCPGTVGRGPCGAARPGAGGRATFPCRCCFRVWWARPGTSAAALAPRSGRLVLLVGACLSWPARPVTLATLAWWSQSWAVHSMTSRRADRAA